MAGDTQATLTTVLQLQDQMSAPLQRAKSGVDSVSQSFKKLQSSGSGTASTFGQIDAQASRAAAKMASLATKFIGLSLAADGLGGQGGALTGVREGLQTFAGLAMALPGPVGLAGGALAGLTVWFKKLSESQEEAAERAREMRREIQDMIKAVWETRGQNLARVMLSKNPALTAAEDQMESIKRQIGTQYGLLSQAEAGMVGKNPLSEEFLRARDSADAAQQKIDELTQELKGLQDESTRLELGDKLKELNAESEVTHEKILSNIITPTEGAEERLRSLQAAMTDLAKAMGSMSTEEYASKMDDLMTRAEKEKQLIRQGKEDEKRQQEEQRRRERGELKKLENSWDGVRLAADEYLASLKTLKDYAVETFRGMEGAMTHFFENMLSGGKNGRNAFKTLLADLKKQIIQTFSTALSQQIMGALAGTLGSALGSGVATAENRAPGSSSSPMVNAAGLGGTFGGLGATSLGGSLTVGGAAAGLGVAAVGYGMYQQGQASGNQGMSIGGGALAGAALGATVGSIIPGLGTAAGALIGAAAGALAAAFGGNGDDKRRQQIRLAKKLVEIDMRNKYAGGLATEEGMNQAGAILSNGIHMNDIKAMGGLKAVLSRRKEIMGIAKARAAAGVDGGGTSHSVSVNAPVTVHATVSGDYDSRRLGQHLGEALDATIRSAAAGAGPGV